jgi:hypothetical protein
MGFDLNGLKPKNKKGEDFRNNVWWWRRLWDFVYQRNLDILTEDEYKSGHYNDGLKIDQKRAEIIAGRLHVLIDNGEAKMHEVDYKMKQDSLEDEECDLCHGTGFRNDKFVVGKCNKCHGKGKVRPFSTWYDFDEENVLSFAEFAENSGGFEIW